MTRKSPALLGPPAFSAWLAARSLPTADREAVLGDLEEEFRTRAATEGVTKARRWYRGQVWRSLFTNIRRRSELQLHGHANRSSDRRHWLGGRGVLQDLKHAVRSLRSTPTFTIVALVVLALGIGATTAIFSVVDGVALRGVPFAGGSRLVVLTEPKLSVKYATGVSPADFADLRAGQTTLEDVAASQGSSGFVLQHDGVSERLRASLVTASLFPILRASAALGRTFTRVDEIPGNERIVILSHAFWQRRFGGDPSIVGRAVTFDNGDWLVVGVMPAAFMYPMSSTRPMDLWAPWAPAAGDLDRGAKSQSYNLLVTGRLKSAVSIAQAQADIGGITARLKAQYPKSLGDRVGRVTTLQDWVVGPAKAWMLMLLASVTFVLLIACVNVANLMLARASARSHDVAVRAALGASRWRLIRGLLAESLVLSAAGTALGVGLAIWCVEVLRASLPASLPRLAEVSVNYRVLIAAAVAAVAVALGVTPMWQSSPTGIGSSLRESGRSGTASAARQRVRTTLLIAEVALAVVLLVGSGLFISSFVRLLRVDLGFDLENVLSVDLINRKVMDADLPRTRATVMTVIDEVKRLPGLQAVALAWGTQPLVDGSDRTSVTVPGKPSFDLPDDWADEKYVTTAYFNVLRVPVLDGRMFTDADDAPGAPPVVILNDVAASRYFGATSPIGVDINIRNSYTVIGVVRSIRLQGPEADLRPEIYLPLNWQHAFGSPLITLMVRTTGDPVRAVQPLRTAIHTAAPELVLPDPQTYGDLFGKLVAQRKFNMIILALFGLLAITIAAAGIYGVMAYLVEQRTQEIGVRMALGAGPTQVLGMILSSATLYLLIGLAIGLSGGWMLSKSVQAFLFKVDAHDPIVYGSVALVLIASGIAAALIPARRAASVDPVIALRAQ